MSPILPKRLFPSARAEASVAAHHTSVPQTEHPAYALAFQDNAFLLRDELRPVRFQLELMKTELALAEAGIASTFVFYGSARIPPPEEAQALIDAATTDEQRHVATKLAEKSRYYDEARALSRIASGFGCEDGCPPAERQFVVCSGGGPSIMEAANRGAADVGAPSIGLNIVLPFEQVPNPYVTPGLSFQFHYFALRKMHFLMRARAVAVFPGGFGTFDELFELLTLVQTGKVKPLPIILFGRAFWSRVVDFAALADEGTIAPGDVELFHIVETADEAWAIVVAHYGLA